MPEVTRDHSSAQPPLHPVWPVIGTFAPAIIASQARDPPLDARAPALATPEGACVFQHLAFLRERARGGDGHTLDPGGFACGLRLG
jgi:hypothetical protein